MSINWNELKSGIGGIVDGAAARTDTQLAGRVAALTTLTDDEVQQLFPDPADVKKLADLMEIVTAAGNRNDKINRIAANIDSLGGVVLSLLGKFVR